MVHAPAATRWHARYSVQLHLIEDRAAGLKGAIAIDSTRLGPAIGECRLHRHASIADLHADAIALAQDMTARAALAGLPFGGGAAVLQLPQGAFDRARLFDAFGRAVQELKGRFVAVEGHGTTTTDMLAARGRTAYAVAGDAADRPASAGGRQDGSLATAMEVFSVIRIATRMVLGTEVSGLRVAIDAASEVGLHLCDLLTNAGARVIVAGLDARQCGLLARQGRMELVPRHTLADTEVDVFVPCVDDGSALTEARVARLKTKLICGADQGRSATEPAVALLHDRGIVYVPGHVAGAGGIIRSAASFLRETPEQIARRADELPIRVEAILTRALAEDRSPAAIADEMTHDIVYGTAKLAA